MDDLEDIVIDEIALEGLNGVCLSRLWNLLEQRRPPFPLGCDDYTKRFLWESLLTQHESISLHVVPEGEEDRDKNEGANQEEKGKGKKTSKPKPVLKSDLVDDAEAKVLGCCSCYKTRKDVTHTVREGDGSNPLSLQQVNEKWGDCLVLVASQDVRFRSILPPITTSDEAPIRSVEYYCVLEYVGRARWAGVVQKNIASHFGMNFSYTFHLCKKLLKRNLILKQSMLNSPDMYLRRFRPAAQCNPGDQVVRIVLDYLAVQPHHMVPRHDLVNYLLGFEGEEITLRRAKKAMALLKRRGLMESLPVRIKDLPQGVGTDLKSEYFSQKDEVMQDDEVDDPDEVDNVKCDVKEIDVKKVKGKNPDKIQVTCLRLLKEEVPDRKGSNVDEEDEEDDDDDAENDLQSAGNGKGRPPNVDYILEKSDFEQVYQYAEKNQVETGGITAADLLKNLFMSKTRLRRVLQGLVRAGLLRRFTYVVGRIREFRYCTEAGMVEGVLPEAVQQMLNLQSGGESDRTPKDEPDKETSVTPQKGSEGSSPNGGATSGTPVSTPKGSASTDVKRSKKGNMSLQAVRRCEMIVSHVKTVRLLEIYQLCKYIRDRERDLGSTTSVCRKSLIRLATKLAGENKVKIITREKKHGQTPEKVMIVTDVTVTDDDPIIQSAIKTAMMRPIIRPPDGILSRRTAIVPKSLKHHDQSDTKPKPAMERYSYSGKMQRLEVLHKFLWYVIHDHRQETPIALEPIEPMEPMEPLEDSLGAEEGGSTTNQEQETDVASTSTPKKTVSNDPSKECFSDNWETPSHIEVYVDTDDPQDWRRYVPPVKFQSGLAEGWTNIGTIVACMPLSLCVQIDSLVHVVPGLTEILQHPRKRHYPMTHLPPFLRDYLKAQRLKMVSRIHVNLQQLSGLGLLYLDKMQHFSSKSMAQFFTCRSGMFWDTTTSAPSCDQVEKKAYEKKFYPFTTRESVDRYWLDFRITCLSTPLGVVKKECASAKRKKEGKSVYTSAAMRNSLCMFHVMSAEPPPVPQDVPGDHYGVGGFDTSYYGFRKTSWDKTVSKYSLKPPPAKKIKTEPEVEVKTTKVSAKAHKEATAGGKGQKRKKKKSTSKKGSEVAKGPSPPPAAAAAASTESQGASSDSKPEPGPEAGPQPKSKASTKKGSLFFKPPNAAVKKPGVNKQFRDPKDVVAIQKKLLRRVKWSAREDNMILLGCLAMRILRVKCPKNDGVKRFVQFHVIRDMLQENFKESYDKTATATSRRARNLMKDTINLTNFSVCLTDIRSDQSIMSDFMSRKADYTDDAVCEKEFKELCLRIGKKFDSRDKRNLQLPSTLSELHSTYNLMDSSLPVATTTEEFESQDVSGNSDVSLDLLRKIVLMSLLAHHYKQRDMKEFYSVLIQYEDRLLQKAVQHFKDSGFMGRQRNTTMDSVSTTRAIHLLPMSFQFTKTFFLVLEAPDMDKSVLTKTETTLRQFTAVHKNEDVCIDDLEGNVAVLLCLPALELVSDTISIPREIMSLKMSDSDRAELEKKHAEEMTKDVTDGDLEDDEECDVAEDAPNEDMYEEDEEDSQRTATKTQAIRDATRHGIAIVQKAHEEWTTRKKAKGSKMGIMSLIPRLLTSQAKDSEEETVEESKALTQASDPDAAAAVTQHALFLDHDYISKDVDAPSSEKATGQVLATAPEPEQNAQKASTSSAEVCEGSSADGDKTRKPPRQKSDSFFAWLAMRGIISQGYSRKPQAIHEDMVIQRCSINLNPTPKLLGILRKHLASNQARDTETGPDQGSDDEHRHKKPGGSRTGKSDRLFQTIGELVHAPYMPFQPLHMADWDYDFCPVEQYNVKEPPKTLDQICDRDVDLDLMRRVHSVIQRKGELGIPYMELLSSERLHGYRLRGKIFQCLRVLVKEQLVFEIGTTVLRLVSAAYASKWLVKYVRSPAHFPQNAPPKESGEAQDYGKKAKVLDDSTPHAGVTESKAVVDNEQSMDLSGQVSAPGHPELGNQSGTEQSVEFCEKRTLEDVAGMSTMPQSSNPATKRIMPTVDATDTPTNNIEDSNPSKRLKESVESSISTSGDNDQMEAPNAADIGDNAQDISYSTPKGKKRKLSEISYGDLQGQCNLVTFISHVWCSIDGTINRRSLVLLLDSVGLLVISKPGVKESDVFHKFMTVMTPVDCLHIIKMLINAGVITRHVSFTSMKMNLFGGRSNAKPPQTVFYQPTAQALVNLTLLRTNILPQDSS